ncbi:unnamed protein product, partial [Ectocarpus fasciculatus]
MFSNVKETPPPATTTPSGDNSETTMSRTSHTHDERASPRRERKPHVFEKNVGTTNCKTVSYSAWLTTCRAVVICTKRTFGPQKPVHIWFLPKAPIQGMNTPVAPGNPLQGKR